MNKFWYKRKNIPKKALYCTIFLYYLQLFYDLEGIKSPTADISILPQILFYFYVRFYGFGSQKGNASFLKIKYKAFIKSTYKAFKK